MIDTDEELGRFVEVLERAPWIAMDTEADSLYAYPERLCLIQISADERDEVIDPLSGVDLAPLWSVLHGRELILHGADFDLRLLRKSVGFVPTRVFDTMIAARLAGERQFGLAALVEKHIGPTLSKKLQKANWARRPLPERLLQYAMDDTRHLKPLAEVLAATLDAKGRREWHRASCERLVEECSKPPEVDPETVWRIRGSSDLAPKGLAALRAAWHWREEQAIAANRPPYFVLSHERLVALAKAVERIPPERLRIPGKLSASRTRTLRAAIARALAAPSSSWPLPAKALRAPRKAKRSDASVLKKHRDAVAADLGIDPTLIANRVTLERLAFDWDEAASELMPWQRELLLPARSAQSPSDDVSS